MMLFYNNGVNKSNLLEIFLFLGSEFKKQKRKHYKIISASVCLFVKIKGSNKNY